MLFLGPILAQVATLSVGDRTEVRRVVLDDTHYEGSTRPQVALDVGWRRFRLSMSYGPLLTLLPLEAKHRDLIVYNSGTISSTYAWGHSSFTVSEGIGYGSQNFQVAALAAPAAATRGTGTTGTGTTGTGTTGTGTTGTGTTGTGTTGTGTTGTGTTGTGTTGTAANGSLIRGTNQDVHYASSATTVGLTHQTPDNVLLHGELSYTVSGGARETDRLSSPLVYGPRGFVSARFRVARDDDFTVGLIAQYASSSIGASVWVGLATGTWSHRFDPRTTAQLGVGLSGTRTPLTFGFVAYQVDPVFTGLFAHTAPVGRGTIGLSESISSAPAIDPVTAAADPRVTVGSAVNYQLKRFSSFVSGGGNFSTAAPSSVGSLTAVGGGAGVAYQLSRAFAADTGIRFAYQTFQGQNTIPLSYAVFVGLSFGLQTPL